MKTDTQVHLQVDTARIVATGISDTGNVRSENEDAIFLDEAGTFLLLADGMGGHERVRRPAKPRSRSFRNTFSRKLFKKNLWT
jgi:serine/threonine protein phosphatase PrpC